MAGIGFQLKELYDQSNFLGQLRAMSFSAIVATGPMFLTILLITVVREWLLVIGTPLSEVLLFMATTQYAFIFSQLLTGGFLFLIARYVADQTFLEQETKVLSSLYGLLAITFFIGFISTIVFYWGSPLSFAYKFLSYLFFVELIGIWILSMYVSALKDYKRIIISYGIGIAISFILSWLFIQVFGWATSFAMMVSIVSGFGLVYALLFRYVKLYFQVDDKNYFDFLRYLERYPALFAIGFFYYLGLYGHSFIVWQGEYQVIVAETFSIAPFYDVPIFYAYLSVLPALVLFMVTIETKFYVTYKKYYSRILNGSSLSEIENAKREMFRVLRLELLFLAQIQLLVILTAVFLGLTLLPSIGVTQGQLDIFIYAAIGSWFIGILINVFMLMLYFDDRSSALKVILLFAGVTMLVTVLSTFTWIPLGVNLFVGGAVGMVASLILMKSGLNEIDYSTFCTQPIVAKQQSTWIEKYVVRHD
ncbi:exopolysaccharide Pel transporter PelG [Chryseomicrobium sp. FSL W7-1435]|uniref:exopolysaccharide Pel transporter PelG n=1 Tax=Chryseomicrobium sp. FSL W7-1435 TaxID=2921704 RepID=UPI00315A7885